MDIIACYEKHFIIGLALLLGLTAFAQRPQNYQARPSCPHRESN